MKKLSFALTAILIVGLFCTSCMKDLEFDQEIDDLQLQAVITLKAGSATVGDSAQIDMPLVMSAQLSTGATSWLWDFGDNTNQSIDKVTIHKYSDIGDYLIKLWVWNDVGNIDSTEQWITIVEEYIPNTIITYLSSASAPDSSGSITYNIAVLKDSIWATSGNFFHVGEFTNWGNENIVDTANNSHYAFFNLVTYNESCKWAYGRATIWANMTSSEFYDETEGTLRTTFYNGGMYVFGSISTEFLPGDTGDTTETPLLRMAIDSTDLTLYFNNKEYTDGIINWPWMTYRDSNEQWSEPIQMTWVDGTGWGMATLDRNLFPADIVSVRFGGNEDTTGYYGNMDQSYFYDPINNCLTFQLIDLNK